MACSAGDKLRASVNELMRNIEGGWKQQAVVENGGDHEDNSSGGATTAHRRGLDSATNAAAANSTSSTLETALTKMFGSCTMGDEAALLSGKRNRHEHSFLQGGAPPLAPHTRSSSTMSSASRTSRSGRSSSNSRTKRSSSSSPSPLGASATSCKNAVHGNNTTPTTSSSTRTPPIAPTSTSANKNKTSTPSPRKAEYGEHIYAQLFFDDQTSPLPPLPPPPPPPIIKSSPNNNNNINSRTHNKSLESPASAVVALYKTPPRAARKYSVIQPYMGPCPQKESPRPVTASTTTAGAAADGLNILLTNTFDDGISAISAYTLEAMVQSEKLGLLSMTRSCDSISLLTTSLATAMGDGGGEPQPQPLAASCQQQHQQQEQLMMKKFGATSQQQQQQQTYNSSRTTRKATTTTTPSPTTPPRHKKALVLSSRDTQPLMAVSQKTQYTSLKTLKQQQPKTSSLPNLVLQSSLEEQQQPHAPTLPQPTQRTSRKTRAFSAARSGSIPRRTSATSSSSKPRATRSKSQPRPRSCMDDDVENHNNNNNDCNDEPPTLGASRSPFFDGRSAVEDEFVVKPSSWRAATAAASAAVTMGSPMSRSGSTLTSRSSINSFQKMWNRDEQNYWSKEAVALRGQQQWPQQQQSHGGGGGGGGSRGSNAPTTAMSSTTTNHYNHAAASLKSGYGTKRVKSQDTLVRTLHLYALSSFCCTTLLISLLTMVYLSLATFRLRDKRLQLQHNAHPCLALPPGKRRLVVSL
jgi:hypothetical protein